MLRFSLVGWGLVPPPKLTVLEVAVSLLGQVRSGQVSGGGAPPAQNASL